MKTVVLFLGFLLITCVSSAATPYKAYLLEKVHSYSMLLPEKDTDLWIRRNPSRDLNYCYIPIPRYQIPKGNVFCIMEDKVTKASNVWLKLGVQ